MFKTHKNIKKTSLLYLLGWPISIKRFAKVHPIFKSRTDLES